MGGGFVLVQLQHKSSGKRHSVCEAAGGVSGQAPPMGLLGPRSKALGQLCQSGREKEQERERGGENKRETVGGKERENEKVRQQKRVRGKDRNGVSERE